MTDSPIQSSTPTLTLPGSGQVRRTPQMRTGAVGGWSNAAVSITLDTQASVSLVIAEEGSDQKAYLFVDAHLSSAIDGATDQGQGTADYQDLVTLGICSASGFDGEGSEEYPDFHFSDSLYTPPTTEQTATYSYQTGVTVGFKLGAEIEGGGSGGDGGGGGEGGEGGGAAAGAVVLASGKGSGELDFQYTNTETVSTTIADFGMLQSGVNTGHGAVWQWFVRQVYEDGTSRTEPSAYDYSTGSSHPNIGSTMNNGRTKVMTPPSQAVSSISGSVETAWQLPSCPAPSAPASAAFLVFAQSRYVHAVAHAGNAGFSTDPTTVCYLITFDYSTEGITNLQASIAPERSGPTEPMAPAGALQFGIDMAQHTNWTG